MRYGFRTGIGIAMFVSLSIGTASANGKCPAIGQSPSCSVLITINPTGSLTFQIDPSVPPFDGIEDVLVGVVNNSGATVFGISLTGSDIFGFDGDGAGTFIGSSGPTGYEGPGTSFSKIDANSGTVNFDNGLSSDPANNSNFIWFSLEGSPSQVRLSHTVTVDPGHGGPTCPKGRTGTTGTFYKIEERNLALGIGLQLKALLEANGDQVTMTRSTANECPSIEERADIANNANTNIFVSIHLDGVANKNGPLAGPNGTAVWYSPEASSTKQLATFIVPKLVAQLGTKNNGIKANGVDPPWVSGQSGRLGVLDNTVMAAVLAEVAFLTNDGKGGGDEGIMNGTGSLAKAANGLFSGIEAFLNQ